MEQVKYVKIIKDSGIIETGHPSGSIYGTKLGCIFRVNNLSNGVYSLALRDGAEFLALQDDCLPMAGEEVFMSGVPKERKENYYELWPGVEALDVIKASLTDEEFLGFLKGNILKYQLRKGNKPGEPLEKDQGKLTHYKQILKKYL